MFNYFFDKWFKIEDYKILFKLLDVSYCFFKNFKMYSFLLRKLFFINKGIIEKSIK